MGDTYFIKNLKCAYCTENNDFEEESMKYGNVGLPYTFEFGGEFVCDKCKGKNEIRMDFIAVTSKSQRKLKNRNPARGGISRRPKPLI